MNLATLFLCILLPLGIAADIIFIIKDFKKQYVAAVIYKGISSCFFIGMGFCCSSSQGFTTFSSLILIGLIFGGVGDIFLNLYLVLTKISNAIFSVGVVAFLLGHFAYEVALLTRDFESLKLAIPIAIGIIVVIVIPLLCMLKAAMSMKVLGAVYLSVISVMLSTSIAMIIRQPSMVLNLLFFIGAFLFFASDIILIVDTFGQKKVNWLRPINLSAYYVGQIMIALCLLFEIA